MSAFCEHCNRRVSDMSPHGTNPPEPHAAQCPVAVFFDLNRDKE